MSDSTTPFMVKKQSNEMKLVLSKDTRVALKTPSGNSGTTTTPIPKSVIREPPPKQDLDSLCDKPIVIPPVPKLISMISKGQSTLAQFFPTKSTPPAPTSNAAPPHTHPTLTHKHRVEELLKTKNLVKHGVSPSSENLSKNRAPSKQGVLVGTDMHKDNLLKKKSPVAKQGLPSILAKTKNPAAQGVAVGGAGVNDVSPTRKREPGSEQSDVRPPKPKRVKTAASTGLPYSRVKTIMKTNIQSSQTTVNTGQESVAVISKATVSMMHVEACVYCNAPYRNCLLLRWPSVH